METVVTSSYADGTQFKNHIQINPLCNEAGEVVMKFIIQNEEVSLKSFS